MSFRQYCPATAPIAIVSSACRFPGQSASPSRLWDLLRSPRDVLKQFNPDHLNLSRFYNPNGEAHGSTNVQNKGYLLNEDTRLFDNAFFNINPLEAEGMDPQQRILLEVVYESLEQAGWRLEDLQGSSTSVHVGAMNADYYDIQIRDTETVPRNNATGTARSILSNRISYTFDLKGPSVTVDTACSSSLVALHQAIQAIRGGDCNVAIVGGVNLIFDPSMYIAESKLHMLSADSRSRMWSGDANGYARGEGVCAMTLKPLNLAVQDGDPIEGVIRGTGVNSDGRSQGITMPTSSAQAALIQHTYRTAGLDPVEDRCQFFECHGTGTNAGDPVEAAAISEALFGADETAGHGQIKAPLYVGSIKTIVGHTEGCAGLAGVLKVLLAIKHRTLPPNLHFAHLNPQVAPYYGRLQIPERPLPWPEVPPGQVRRASVNSFGFGGTNAHAIIEEFKPPQPASEIFAHVEDESIGPFIFSARSRRSLLSNITSTLSYLEETPSIQLKDLAWTLQNKRSHHRVKAVFVGENRTALLAELRQFVNIHRSEQTADKAGHVITPINPSEIPGTLGVFTGQGAQWPTMGRELIRSSQLFRKSLEQCDAALRGLPDSPDWSLIDELTACESTSRVAEAALSQPLCTAVQLALIDVVYAAGLRFDAVVGHSSGEIGAVYACGIISRESAMQISFYRGLYAKLARGPTGQRGGMIAVGISYSKAKEFCKQAKFDGRIAVAASNSPESVTLSGDFDAVEEAKVIFDGQNTFARHLKVDTAYHSHHMELCASRYLESLQRCNIQVHRPRKDCYWSSSVRGDAYLLKGNLEPLKASYWVANMRQTVLFSQALESSIWHGGPFDVAFEIGPHPALKGPTEQTMKSAMGHTPAYFGVLKRGANDVSMLSSALGYSWIHTGASINFREYRKSFVGHDAAAPKTISGLPSYAWQHDQVHWRESRISRQFRLGTTSHHVLLGRRTPDDSEMEMRWRNVLKLSELLWLRGHEVLDEVLLPGAAYISLAVEAAKQLASTRPVRLLEFLNVEILRPVVVPDDKDGTETLFTTRIACNEASKVIADFSYYYCADEVAGTMVLTCGGRLVVHLGKAAQNEIPPREPQQSGLLDIRSESIYQAMADIGLKYTGIFRGLVEVRRSRGFATSSALWPENALAGFTLHPALLDVVFQSLFVARSHPSSGQMTGALLPVHIERVLVNPSAVMQDTAGPVALDIDSFVTQHSNTTVIGDLHASEPNQPTYLQVEGLTLKAVAAADVKQDRQMFSKTVWKADASLGISDIERCLQSDGESAKLAEAIDRLALFYMRQSLADLSEEETKDFAPHHQQMLESFKFRIGSVSRSKHPLLQKHYLADSEQVVDDLLDRYPGQIDLQLTRAVGKNLGSVLRGRIQLLEVMLQDGMLERFYMEGCGLTTINQSIKTVLEQITHKFPRTNILEIGAGTGAAAWSALHAIDNAYESYTYTDISTGFFDNAAEKFGGFAAKMIFKPLDIEKPVDQQGFAVHSYDIVIAANVLHATRSMKDTMTHARSLLKPGGFLVLLEATGRDILRLNFIMGGLPGWWLGEKDGRKWHPGLSPTYWDGLLRETGFSGIENIFHDLADEGKHCNSLIVSQATDETFIQFREPDLAHFDDSMAHPMLIIGGSSLPVVKIIREIQRSLGATLRDSTRVVGSIDQIDLMTISPGTDVICLQELDKPILTEAMTDDSLSKMQGLFMNAKNFLWVTKQCHAKDPSSNMFLGIARALFQELPHVNLQCLNFETMPPSSTAARHVYECFIRLILATESLGDILWTQEPEVTVEDDQIAIPRVLPDYNMNLRYNASRRDINEVVDTTEVEVKIKPDESQIMLNRIENATIPTNQEQLFRLLFTASLPIGDHGPLYLSCSHRQLNDEYFLILSNSLASLIANPESYLRIPVADCNPIFLSRFVEHMLADSIEYSIDDGPIMIYEASSGLANILSQRCRHKGLEVHFVTSRTPVPSGWVYVHPSATVRSLKAALLRPVSMFIHCQESSAFDQQLLNCLPKQCQFVRLSSCLSGRWDAGEQAQQLLSSPHSGLVASADAGIENSNDKINILRIDQLAAAEVSKLSPRHIIDWKPLGPLALTVSPIGLQTLLNPSKTYLLVGMAGGLGLSVCQWMVETGARHLVITSRKPDVSSQWLDNAKTHGIDVKIEAMDVSDRHSVESMVRRVNESMPAIAGVCNAAMVLSDSLFVDMNATQLSNTLKPKVDGTQFLHDALTGMDLDFFILFSSLAAIVGHAGQANYHAANMFMTSLAAKRRLEGLAASVIHIGLVTDTGYITRQDRSIEDRLRSQLFLPLSETDVHHAFSEAIAAGRPDSNRQPDIVMGIEPITQPMDHDRLPKWLSNPRFSHFVPPKALQTSPRRTKANAQDLIKAVGNSDSEDHAISIVQEAFCGKLESIMQLPAGSVQAQQPIIELGIDSLVAVEIRTWFLKELGVEVAVIKILGGDTISQTCTIAAKKALAINQPKIEAVSESQESSATIDANLPSTHLTDSTSTEEMSTAPTPMASSLSNSTNASSESGDIPSLEKYEVGDSSLTDTALAMPSEQPHDVKLEEHEQEMVKQEVMSDAQSRLWFLSQHQKNPVNYVSVTRLRFALTSIMQRHEILRTRFFARIEDGQPLQGVLSNPDLDFQHIDKANDNDVASYYSTFVNRVWDLERGKTFGAVVLTKGNGHTLIFGYHHIIMDSSAWAIFLHDLNAAYALQLPRSNVPGYIDYTAKYRSKQQDYQKSISFWENELSGTSTEPLPLLPVSSVRVRPANQSYETHHVHQQLGASNTAALKNICRSLRITPFHFHLAVLQCLLVKYLDVRDVCIGIADANRADAEFADTMGCFMNMLPAKFQMSNDASFSDVAQRTSRKMHAVLDNAIPFDLILEKLNISRSSTHTPIFQVAMNYRLGDFWEVPMGDCSLLMREVEDAKNPYDLSFAAIETSEGSCILELYCQSAFYNLEASRMILDAYMNLLQLFIDEPNRCPGETPLNKPEHISQALNTGAGPNLLSEGPLTLSDKFEQSSITHTNKIAIRETAGKLTYAQLSDRVNSIAAWLLGFGCQSGSRVAVLCEPSADFIACMLAVLTIGAIYIPLDVSLPASRHEAIIENSQAELVFHHSATVDQVQSLQATFAGALRTFSLNDIEKTKREVSCNATAYGPAILLYTSGSTGKPKGIMLSQSNFVHFVEAKDHVLDIGQQRVLQQSSFGFDMSVVQTFCALSKGGSLIIVPQSFRRDPVELARLMHDEKITFTIATPSEYSSWIRFGGEELTKNTAWSHACMGGEVITEQLKRDFLSLGMHNIKLTNWYGPTEIAAAATWEPIVLELDSSKTGQAHSVGKALPNTAISIVDKYDLPLPLGHTGEICVTSPGVASGYLGLPQLTEKRFVRGNLQSDRLRYRTGDQGRLLEDGTLLLFGRLDGDTQIKFHGVRMELEEIERAVMAAAEGAFSNVVVSPRGDILVAHAVMAPHTDIEEQETRHFLDKIDKPQYMIPAMIIPITSMPVTSNGKVDRKAVAGLPLPEARNTSPESPTKLTVKEGELRLLWERVLPPHTGFTPDSDFFMHGGNSILLMKLQKSIKEAMGASMSTRDLYGNCTLRQMAESIGTAQSKQISDNEEINWAEETTISQKYEALGPLSKRPSDSKLEVLMTGVNSFLGASILETLIASESVVKVHCVAVMPDEESKVIQSPKITTYVGSLTSPKLGLSVSTLTSLQNSVDVIIHAGSSGHCLNRYSSLRVPNVHSTRFLAGLAAPASIPILYLSSNRVAMLSGSVSPAPMSMSAFLPPIDGAEGFTASKWASEEILQKAASQYSSRLRVAIHRPCIVVGDQAPNSDALNAILRYSLQMRAVPRFEKAEGFMDFKAVGSVGEEIAQAAIDLANRNPPLSTSLDTNEQADNESSPPAVRFSHHSGGVKIPIGEFGAHMSKLHNSADFATLDLRTWIARALEHGIDPLITAYLEGIIERGETIRFAYLGSHHDSQVEMS